MSGGRLRFQADPSGGRLDRLLVPLLPELSRNRIQHLIREGRVLVEDRPVTKPGFRLEGGEWIEVDLPPPIPSRLEPEPLPLDVVFENEDVLVVSKPAGMVVHPSAGHPTGTLVHAALAHAPDLRGVGGELRPGVVHRLDKDTSGLILLAKHDAAHHCLQEQFRRRQVEKVYLALVDGHPPTPVGRIEAPIGRDRRQRQRMTVVPEGRGREAITEYRRLETFADHELLEVRPITGRTHQVRVHLAFLGCPVAGDRVYGRRRRSVPLGRHFLHAARLRLRLPGDRTPRTFEAPLPPDLEAVLDLLRGRRLRLEPEEEG